MVEDVSDCPDRELIPAEALAHVPGYTPDEPSVQIARLTGGSVNRSYRVLTPAGPFVLRLSPATDAWLAADRSVERELHRIAAAADIAPRIVHADERDRWLITELVTGSLWTGADFANPTQLGRLADALRVLHSLSPPACGHFDVLGALDGYAERIRTADASVQRQLAGHLKQAADAWSLSGAAERRPAILHHDLHASNLIDARDDRGGRLAGVKLIDWECAAVADPLLDIACILSYYDTARAHADLLLARAGLAGTTQRQLAASVWIFDLHTLLWYRERRLRLSPTEAEHQAERRLCAAVAHGVQNAL